MNKIKLILALGTLLMTTVSTLVVVGVRAFEPQTAGAQDAGQDDEPSPEDKILNQQAELETELSDMQASEAEYIALLDDANDRIEELNAELEELQTEAYESHAQVEDLQANIDLAYATGSQFAGEAQAMQARESQWQDALAQANQTIAELQAYIDQYNAAAAAPAPSGGGGGGGNSGSGSNHEREDDDHDEDEHEDERDDD